MRPLTRDQFDQLRPWHDGGVTDAGYVPPRSLIHGGYLRREIDNFWSLTEKGKREIERLKRPARAAGERADSE